MHADLESILWKFGGNPAICLREEAICAKVYRRMADDGRLAIALAHSWNEQKINNMHCAPTYQKLQLLSQIKTADQLKLNEYTFKVIQGHSCSTKEQLI